MMKIRCNGEYIIDKRQHDQRSAQYVPKQGILTDQYNSMAVVSASSSVGHVVVPRRRRQNPDYQMPPSCDVLPISVVLTVQVDVRTEGSCS
jgi:hypothetical protein